MFRHVTHARDALEDFLLLAIVHLCDRVFLMTGSVCPWKPFWIPVGDTFQKAYLEEWQRVDDGFIRDPGENSIKTVPCAVDSMRQRRAKNSDCDIKYEQPLDAPSAPRSSWQAVGQPDAPTWKLSGTQVLQPSGKIRRRHCLYLRVGAVLSIQNSSVPFLNVWNCRIPTERSYQAMRKTFPSFGSVLLRGYKQTLTIP